MLRRVLYLRIYTTNTNETVVLLICLVKSFGLTGDPRSQENKTATAVATSVRKLYLYESLHDAKAAATRNFIPKIFKTAIPTEFEKNMLNDELDFHMSPRCDIVNEITVYVKHASTTTGCIPYQQWRPHQEDA